MFQQLICFSQKSDLDLEKKLAAKKQGRGFFPVGKTVNTNATTGSLSAPKFKKTTLPILGWNAQRWVILLYKMGIPLFHAIRIITRSKSSISYNMIRWYLLGFMVYKMKTSCIVNILNKQKPCQCIS